MTSRHRHHFDRNWKPFVSVVVVALLFAYFSFVAQRAEDRAEETYTGIQCLLVQLQQHRIGNRDTDFQLAEKLGFVPHVHPDIQTPERIDLGLLEKCEPFYE